MDEPGALGGDEGPIRRRVIESAPLIVMTLDPEGRITWLGGAVEPLTGWTADELVGTNILDHIDADWNPAALESVGFAFTRHGLQRPMLFKVLRKDGTSFVGEATANSQMDDPVVGGLVAYLRRWDERHLLDRVIEDLAAGVSLDSTFRLLVEVMGAETLDGDGAVLLQPFAGRFSRAITGTRLPTALASDDGSAGTPWHQAMLTGTPRWQRTEELVEPLRRIAVAAGYRWCWAWPAAGHGGSQACLVVWRRADEEPDYTCRWLLDNLVPGHQPGARSRARRRRGCAMPPATTSSPAWPTGRGSSTTCAPCSATIAPGRSSACSTSTSTTSSRSTTGSATGPATCCSRWWPSA